MAQISWHYIVEYFKVFIDTTGAHFGNKDFEDFYFYMRLMDDKMIELHEKKQASKKK